MTPHPIPPHVGGGERLWGTNLPRVSSRTPHPVPPHVGGGEWLCATKWPRVSSPRNRYADPGLGATVVPTGTRPNSLPVKTAPGGHYRFRKKFTVREKCQSPRRCLAR